MKKRVKICKCNGKMCYEQNCAYCGYSTAGNENWVYCNKRDESVRPWDCCDDWFHHTGRW